MAVLKPKRRAGEEVGNMVIGFNTSEEKEKMQKEVMGDAFLEEKEMILEPYITRQTPTEFTLILPKNWKLGRFIKAVEGKKHFSLLKVIS